MTDCRQLLDDYARHKSEPAFRELVSRYLNLVYSCALRLVNGDAHRAEDVVQVVFADLARKAGELAPEVMLGGWLHRHTCFVAANTMRGERRRQAREREAIDMNLLHDDNPHLDFARLAPLLDESINELDDADRTAILLRFFEQKEFSAVGQVLGSSEEASRKRVNRALDKLRELLAQRGIRTTAGALSIAVSANVVQAAPAGLAATVSAAALAGTAVTTSTLIATTKTIVMTTFQKIAVTAALTATIGAGIYEAKQAHDAQEENSKLRTAQKPLADDLANLRAENEKLSNAVAEAKNQQKLTQSQFSELMKLRGQAGQAKTAVQQLAKAQAALKKHKPAFAMIDPQQFSAFDKKTAAARVSRMKMALNLSDAQVQSITDILFTYIDRRNEMLEQDIRSGNLTSITNGDGLITVTGHSGVNGEMQEDEIKAQLSPDQVAEYDTFKNGEEVSAHDDAVSSEALAIATEFSLKVEQQHQIQEQIAQSGLDTINRISITDTNLAAAWLATGDQSIVAQIAMNQSLARLTNRLNLLQSVLTPAQLEQYRQEQQTQIEAMKGSMSTFPPQPNGATTSQP